MGSEQQEDEEEEEEEGNTWLPTDDAAAASISISLLPLRVTPSLVCLIFIPSISPSPNASSIINYLCPCWLLKAMECSHLCVTWRTAGLGKHSVIQELPLNQLLLARQPIHHSLTAIQFRITYTIMMWNDNFNHYCIINTCLKLVYYLFWQSDYYYLQTV